MTDFRDFRGEAKRIEDLDIPRIGHRIGVGEDELHAFMDVEAAGSGFDRQGRPKMLFEPHVFYRNLKGAERSAAVAKGIAYAKWKSGAYPSDSYPRLLQAIQINETAALKAASWGLGQILGENFFMVGYESPQGMVLAFMDDEAAHLDAIVSFLIAAGIDDDLKAHRWETVARVYNGPQHAKHDYAGRMKKAYAKWAKIPDTPWTPDGESEIAEAPAAVAVTPPKATEISDPSVVRLVQTMLRDKGYPEVGTIDGKMGERTRDAVIVFQRHAGLALTGLVNSELLEALAKAEQRPVSKERATATAKDLKGAEGVKIGGIAEKAGVVIAAGSAIGAILDGSGGVEGYLNAATQVTSAWNMLASSGPWVAGIAIGLGALYLGRRQIADQVEKFRAGRHV